MNAYTILLEYIRSLAIDTNYVNTITKGDYDLDKMDICPLFNIDILTGTFPSTSTVSFDVDLQCLDIRDINKDVVNDKFYRNDNEVDNHNNTLSALNEVWVKMMRDFKKNDITASEDPSFEKITFSGKDLLDGWRLTFTVEMPINELSLCYESNED